MLVTGVASNLCFDLLTGQSPGEESPPNDGFVPIHRSLNEASSVVARTTLPADATMLFDGGNMLIALRRPTRTRDRCGPRWNDDVSLRMSIRHSVVDSLTIICAVGYHRRDPRCDLIKKTHYFRYVADIVLRQFNGDDFMRFGIDAEMQFAPTPRGTNTTLLIQPLALAIDLQTSTVDEEMEWFVTTNRPWQNGQPAPSAAQCRVVGNCNIDVEQSRNRSQQSFSLTQRLVEHQAKRKRGLDGYCRIDRLTATPSGGWCTPLSDRLVGEPHRQCTPPHQSCVIVRPVRDTIFRGGDFVATRFVELVRHGFLHRGKGQSATLPFGHLAATPVRTISSEGKRSTRVADVIQPNLRVHAIKLHVTPGRDQFGRRAVGLAARTATAAAQLMPRVLNMRDLPDGVPDGAIYCGRPMPRRHLSGSPFANPFKLRRNATARRGALFSHGAGSFLWRSL